MFLDALGALTGVFGSLIKLIPNAEDRLAATKAIADFEIAMTTAQNKVNEIEAARDNIFISGWRPMVGWVCVCGLVYQVVQPMFHLPAADMSTLMAILVPLLGIGTLRTVEKISGRA